MDRKGKLMKLASRLARLQAIIIDIIGLSFISMLVMLPTIIFKINITTSLFFNQIIMFILGLVIFYFLNKKSLLNDGQTMGKSILKIKIVNVDYTSTSENMLLKRYLLLFLLSAIPVVGAWLSAINCAFIFTKDKRCIHDIITKTIVVYV
jgi:uncharacterized RDD family membrane protein YckC